MYVGVCAFAPFMRLFFNSTHLVNVALVKTPTNGLLIKYKMLISCAICEININKCKTNNNTIIIIINTVV